MKRRAFKRPLTLERLLSVAPDSKLFEMHEELESRKVPNTSAVKEFVERANRLIDRGEMCTNSTDYRHIYTPTLRKALYKEMADRYVVELKLQAGEILSPTELYDEVEFDKLLKGSEAYGSTTEV